MLTLSNCSKSICFMCIKGSPLNVVSYCYRTNLGPIFRSSRLCWVISWFVKFKTAGLSKDLLPLNACVLFPLFKYWYFSVMWFLSLTYSLSFELFVMCSIVSKYGSINTLLNSYDTSFTLILYGNRWKLIDTEVIRYGKNKVLNRHGTSVKKWKHSIKIWCHFF